MKRLKSIIWAVQSERLTLELGSANGGQIKLGRVSVEAQREYESFKELSNACQVK